MPPFYVIYSRGINMTKEASAYALSFINLAICDELPPTL